MWRKTSKVCQQEEKKFPAEGPLAGIVEPATLDLRVVSSSPKLAAEITFFNILKRKRQREREVPDVEDKDRSSSMS